MSAQSDTLAGQHNKQSVLFTEEEALLLAEQLKALAHPVRLQILQSLGNLENCCCNDFCASIPLAQSTISQHLKILNKAGMIDYRPVGNCSHYSLNPEVLAQAINKLTLVSRIINKSGSCELSGIQNQESKE